GYSTSEHQLEVKDGQETLIEDVLYQAGALSVEVADHAGDPAVGLTVSISPTDPKSIETPRLVTAGADGAVVVRGLRPGWYEVACGNAKAICIVRPKDV